jgi:Leucine-rich repeat (LRR) protein
MNLDLRHKTEAEIVAALAAGRVEELQLDGAKLKKIPDAVFAQTGLRKLTVFDNKLGSMPKPLFKLGNLVELSLAMNKIRTVPKDVGALTQLERLYLSHNEIAGLPVEIASLSRLRLLDVSGNQIGELPDLGGLAALEELDVSSNGISALPGIERLSQLRKLDISTTLLVPLPETIAALPSLESLKLSQLRLEELPGFLGRAPRLASITMLSANELRRIAPELARAPLRELTLGACRQLDVESVWPVVAQMAEIESLAVTGAGYSTAPPLPRGLRKLDINYNKVSVLPPIDVPLESLSIDKNPLDAEATLTALGKIPTLRSLSAREMGWAALPDAIGGLTALQELDLRSNTFTDVPASLLTLRGLKRLSLSNNRIAAPVAERLRAALPDTDVRIVGPWQ